MTLPREIKLHSISEDLPPQQEEDQKPKIPQPGILNFNSQNSINDQSQCNETGKNPTVPMPGIENVKSESSSHAPVVPMPNNDDISHVKVGGTFNAASIFEPNLSTDEVKKPVVPQPNLDTNRLSVTSNDTFITTAATPETADNRPTSTVMNFSVTLPMPNRRKSLQQDRTRDLDPIRSNSMQSIRDEIIDGLQKMSSRKASINYVDEILAILFPSSLLFTFDDPTPFF